MSKKILIISVLLITLTICSLYADKTLERIAAELYKEGEDLYNSGKSIEAAKTFESAITKLKEAEKIENIPLDNDKITYWFELAFNGYLKGKDFENALRIQNERIKLDQGNYNLISTKAILLKKYLKRVDEAIVVLKEYNTTKRSFKVEKKIASYYTEKKDYANALKWYKKTYKIKQDSRVIKKIASLYLKLDKKEEAIEAYENFIKTNPNERVLTMTYKNMGALYDKMNNAKKAILYYEKSLSIEYRRDICLVLIPKYYEKKQFDKANVVINKLLEKRANDPTAIYYRGLIKFYTNDKEGAKIDFQKIISDPTYGADVKKRIESIESE